MHRNNEIPALLCRFYRVFLRQSQERQRQQSAQTSQPPEVSIGHLVTLIEISLNHGHAWAVLVALIRSLSSHDGNGDKNVT